MEKMTPEFSPAQSPTSWSPLQRIGFRVVSLYLLLYIVASGNDSVVYVVPKAGALVASWVQSLVVRPAEWLARNYCHLSGVAASVHPTGSGDTAIHWISIGVMLAYAVVAALIWSLLQPHRLEYQRAAAWLRLLVRLTLVIALANYGLSKLFPTQMPPPSLAVLNEPVGNMSPMTLLWTFVGMNPVYEMVCGAIELSAAVLLFFRRTVLLGAILSAFVTSNVLLFNLFFDVPVKIYSAHLVLLACVLIAPDVPALWDFFWRHKPAFPDTPAMPATGHRSTRIAIVVLEAGVLLMILSSLPGHSQSFARTQASLRHPSPFTGAWRIDGGTSPVLTPAGQPMVELFLEPNGRATMRDSSGVLWRAGFQVQDEKREFSLFREVQSPLFYTFAQPDTDHLVLTATGDSAAATSTLSLTRVSLPSRYPLLNEGFHLVNEWPRER